MNNHKKLSGIITNIVIVLLVVSAVFFGWKSRLFGNASAQTNDIFNFFGSLVVGNENAGQAATQTAASKPLCIVVTNAEGEHFGVKYNMDEINALYYGKTDLIFGEALGSALTAEKVTEAEWRDALLFCGVYFEYITPVKLSVLDGWYGSEISGDWGEFSVRRLCVATEEGKNRLYFLDEDSGDFYAADAAESNRIAVLAESVGINSTVFASEMSGDYKSPDCYTLLKLDVTGYPVVEVKNPLAYDAVLSDVLLNLGISEQEKSSYTDGEGIHYVGVGFTITIPLSPDGTLIYRRTETSSDAVVGLDESEVIETARRFIAVTIAESCGSDAAVYFDSIKNNGTDSYQVYFNYVVAGGVVRLGSGGYAASVTVSNGGVTDMKLYFRSYADTSEMAQLLPEILVAAASDGAFKLCYPDNGVSRMEPVWVGEVG